MRLLILGGSWFLGRTVVSDALARGWEVTAFSRGKSGQPPTGATHVVGDRRNDADLHRLAEHGPWDALIDTSAYEPVDVAQVTDGLADLVEQYVLISTVSAYPDWPASPVDESSPLWPSSPTYTEQSPELAHLTVGGQYGTLKAGCEAAAIEGAKRSLILRPGVILAPGECVGRGLKLLDRAARGGRWLLPAPAEQPIQPIDVRDPGSSRSSSCVKRRRGRRATRRRSSIECSDWRRICFRTARQMMIRTGWTSMTGRSSTAFEPSPTACSATQLDPSLSIEK
ncbi:NAD-dependent epimerase/dehydratase family protein [Kribbella sp. NPDC051587]|uniref:NAD-dependent epimerase/dehydratase family protein n=1 Tax=Kribbella sp. NPDC051587 TaxID=3364119 RepID=UPI00379BDA8C